MAGDGSIRTAKIALGAAGIAAALAGLHSALRASTVAALRGRVVLVTGGSRGLGLAIARRLVEVGARVAICGRDPTTLDRAREDLLARGGAVLAIPCDAIDPEQVEAALEQVRARWGPVDALITVAATIEVAPIELMTLSDFRAAMDSVFWSTVVPTLAVLPEMERRREGRIAHVTSIGGKIAIPHLVPYSAAKFAEVGFSEGLRAEVARHGIRVTTIVPGLMRTGSHVHARFKGRVDAEYGWFGLGATAPVSAIDTDRAARAIVAAIANGDEERVLGVPAMVAERAHALLPSLARRALGAVARGLPDPVGQSASEPWREGIAIEESATERPDVRAVARLGHDATLRYHQR
jgi:NAD(P)-dependent dehydrogenase (short-subunit alcohol dehydrogenase family)